MFRRIRSQFAIVLLLVSIPALLLAEEAPLRNTRVAIDGTRWLINGKVTFPGTPAEGLLMNVRMVNATFEDRNRDDFDPDANTSAFLAAMPEYVEAGARAFTLNLQGGMPGYEGTLNSAFDADGSVRSSYLDRIARVIEACDRAGVVVILGCFYQRQDQVLKDEAAVRAAVANTARWIKAQGYTNVLLEVANEFAHNGYDHAFLRKPEMQAELIQLAHREYPGLLVSTSGMGTGQMHAPVAEAADFLLPHYNTTTLQDLPARISALKSFGKPVVCNEDDRIGEEAAEACRMAVEAGTSYGLMLSEKNQYQPFEFEGVADDPVFYGTLELLTRQATGSQGTAPPRSDSPRQPRD